MAYPRLFEPVQIGSLTLKNRIAMAPMETHLGTPTARSIPTSSLIIRKGRAGEQG